MDFSFFANSLRPIIGGENKIEEFTQELFRNITDFPNDEENIVENTALKTYKSYYLGDRRITMFAVKIRKYVEPTLFENYIYDQTEEAQEEILKALSSYSPEMNRMNISEKTAELFKEIIYAASVQKRRATKKEKKEKEISACQEDFILLDEANMRCPVCGERLLQEKKKAIKCRYRVVQIIPAGADNVLLKKLEAINFSVPDKDDSRDNKILLCNECFEEHDGDNIHDILSLAVLKQSQLQRKMIMDAIDGIYIEDAIADIIQRFSELTTMPARTNRNDFDVFRVDRKVPANIVLQDTITELVLKYYRFIEDLFKQYEKAGLLRFNKVKNEISQCFENLDEQELPQQVIFDTMVNWLVEQTKTTNRIACQAVIAFFVQNCEVFYETTE